MDFDPLPHGDVVATLRAYMQIQRELKSLDHSDQSLRSDLRSSLPPLIAEASRRGGELVDQLVVLPPHDRAAAIDLLYAYRNSLGPNSPEFFTAQTILKGRRAEVALRRAFKLPETNELGWYADISATGDMDGHDMMVSYIPPLVSGSNWRSQSARPLHTFALQVKSYSWQGAPPEHSTYLNSGDTSRIGEYHPTLTDKAREKVEKSFLGLQYVANQQSKHIRPALLLLVGESHIDLHTWEPSLESLEPGGAFAELLTRLETEVKSHDNRKGSVYSFG